MFESLRRLFQKKPDWRYYCQECQSYNILTQGQKDSPAKVKCGDCGARYIHVPLMGLVKQERTTCVRGEGCYTNVAGCYDGYLRDDSLCPDCEIAGLEVPDA